MTFKKIIQSPEHMDHDCNMASDVQYMLWSKFTSEYDKYKLWFILFDSYYRVKLWNKLSFSEDYMISVINTQKYTRQDLALKISKQL
jgi:hypothetical protein